MARPRKGKEQGHVTPTLALRVPDRIRAAIEAAAADAGVSMSAAVVAVLDDAFCRNRDEIDRVAFRALLRRAQLERLQTQLQEAEQRRAEITARLGKLRGECDDE